ncbi:sensor histidine kinase [Dyella sp. 2RAB6]|uniref:sensor histidine kinase n=1 Tax=Dyella sp. 2RAB6 TaxID=3232992 RepID=UPI003F91ED52
MQTLVRPREYGFVHVALGVVLLGAVALAWRLSRRRPIEPARAADETAATDASSTAAPSTAAPSTAVPSTAAPTGTGGAAIALDRATLAAISHDVRTPLTGIVGALELLGYSELTPRQRALVDGAEQASRTLQARLEDVLVLARLEADAAPPAHHPFDLRELVAGVLGRHAGGQEIQLELDPRIAARFIGDGGGLRQILDKLLAHFLSRGLGRPPQWQISVLSEGAHWQSLELVLSARQSPSPSADATGHGDELAWVAACKLCEWMGFSLHEQGSTWSDPRFVMRGCMNIAACDASKAPAGLAVRQPSEEPAAPAREDAQRVARRLVDVFGEDAAAMDDYLQLVRNEEQRLLVHLDAGHVQRLREVAHYLCGMGSFFGAQRLAGMAIAVELGQGEEEVLGHAKALHEYLAGFIDALHWNGPEAFANTNNTNAISDFSYGNTSGAALER